MVVFRLNTMVTRTWGGKDDGFGVKCMFERLKVTSSTNCGELSSLDGWTCFFLFRRLQGLLFSYSGTCGYLLSLNNMSQAI